MFNQQLEAFEKFSKLKIGALFMQMGTGKTRIALELINYNNVDFLIYLTPFSTKNNIQAEFDKWGVNCPYEIVGYETIQSSDRVYLELIKKCTGKKCFIIADESIFIKNEETKRFDRALQLRKLCEYALVLNGTPLTKSEWDLYNQMYFLSPLIINMNRNDFLTTFFTHVKYKKKGQKEKEFYKFSEINAKALHKMIEPYVFKADLDFGMNEQKEMHYVPYLGGEYYTQKEDALEKLRKEQNPCPATILALLTKLNVVASSYNKKLDKIIEYAKDKQLIIYCNYLAEADYLKKNMDCYIITGDTKEKHRTGIIDGFKYDNNPLVMTYGVGSCSLNLQFCNEIVYSSINFVYSLMEQSQYRIKRIGQERDIKYTYFLTDLGINKIILENLTKKQDLSKLIKDEINIKNYLEVNL